MILSFDIGGTTIKSALGDTPDQLKPLNRQPTPASDLEAFVGAISRDVSRAPDDTIIAMSITGVIDPETGIVTCANIPCIDGLSLASVLRQRLARPVHIVNDADCFVLAEAGFGAGRGKRVVFGAILGTGVGGGLVIDSRLHQGVGGLTGEWGHGPVAGTQVGDPPVAIPRLKCGCGQIGCLDTVGGARGLERLYQHLNGEFLDSQQIIAAWEAGDANAARAVSAQIELLAGPLALVVNVVGADVVPVGGGLSRAARLVSALDTAVRQRILRRIDQPLVVPGIAQGEPGWIGAALFATGGA
ncbi:N-acetylglucosamine kinase [Devosia pacifica]|uniref:N-acetylglucosamine kinase n=1 Tax=Devosia pacifica TaxID=1335967 RepID=A0A918VS23_9HYPH|nr:ROK family protein [Devosia pacifica]GHA18068.1 N-acetylglucosamine kinase [Devosia pacifica]